MKKKLFLISIALLSTVGAFSQMYEKDGVRYTFMTNYYLENIPHDYAIASKLPDNPPTGNLAILSSVQAKNSSDSFITATVTHVRSLSYCDGLTSVIIPNSVLELGAYCFQNDSNLVKVQLSNNIKILMGGTFENCVKLKDIVLPEGLTKILQSFSNCISLESINIPTTLEDLDSRAFYGCSSLREVHISNLENWVKFIIDQNSFPEDCTFLLNGIEPEIIEIPKDAKYLKACFNGWKNLKTVTIPEGVESLSDTFRHCPNITDIYCYATKCPNIYAAETFDDIVVKKAILHVPSSVINKYKSHISWGEFFHIVPIGEDQIENVKDNRREIYEKSYNMNGIETKDRTGLMILHKGDGTSKKILMK